MAEAQREPIRIERLLDASLITETIRHPRIYPHVKDDSCPPAESFAAVLTPQCVYVGAYRGEQYLGLFMLHQHTCVLWEVHTCLLPDAWGFTSLDCTRACAAWAWANTTCQRLITAVPDGNELARRLALRSGMTEYGHNPRSLLRGGELVGQSLLGMNRD
jgi:hypothetical protein